MTPPRTFADSLSAHQRRSSEREFTLCLLKPRHFSRQPRRWSPRLSIPQPLCFMKDFFTLDPSLCRLFKNADIKEQRRKPVQALAAVINGIDNLPSSGPTLEAVGRNHVRYGVTDQHYDTVGTALLWTLEQGLREAWTPAASAWTAAYATVAGVMCNAAASELKQAAHA